MPAEQCVGLEYSKRPLRDRGHRGWRYHSSSLQALPSRFCLGIRQACVAARFEDESALGGSLGRTSPFALDALEQLCSRRRGLRQCIALQSAASNDLKRCSVYEASLDEASVELLALRRVSRTQPHRTIHRLRAQSIRQIIRLQICERLERQAAASLGLPHDGFDARIE